MDLATFLDDLELNKYEKNVILYLSTVDSADAKTLCKNTKVPTGRIYSVLQQLKQQGFVDVIPTKPKKYVIKDIKISLTKFLNSKRTGLKERLNQVASLELKPKTLNLNKKDPSVHMLSGRQEHLDSITSFRHSAKKELLQIAPVFVGSFASKLSLKKALQRGVSVKIIIKSLTAANTKNVRDCIANGGHVSQLNSPDLLSLLIKDSSEFLLGVENHLNSEERLTLYSRNPSLLNNLEKTFYDMWKKAKPVKKC